MISLYCENNKHGEKIMQNRFAQISIVYINVLFNIIKVTMNMYIEITVTTINKG